MRRNSRIRSVSPRRPVSLDRLAAVFAFLLLVAALAGACAARMPAAQALPPARQRSRQPAGLESPASFRMVSSSTAYSVDGSKISLTIFNNTDQDAMFGAAYALEIQSGGDWYDVPLSSVKPGTEPTWPAISYQLPAQGRTSVIIDMDSHGDLEPGHYRVIKQVRVMSGSGEPVHVVARFDVLKNGSLTGEATAASTAVLYTSQFNPEWVQDSVLGSAAPALCKALWDIKTVDLTGFKRTWASRQAVFPESDATLTFEVVPKMHDRSASAQWVRSVEDGIEVYRRNNVSRGDVADGSGSGIYGSLLRVESGTLTGTLRRETSRKGSVLADVTLDALRKVAKPAESIPPELRQVDERWTVSLANGQVSLEIAITPPPFDHTAMIRWAQASDNTAMADGAITFRMRKRQEAASQSATIEIAYPASIGLVEVHGSTLGQMAKADADKALAFIDVNFVREIIARLT